MRGSPFSKEIQGARSLGYDSVAPTVLFDLRRDHPLLAAAAARLSPELGKAIDSLRNSCPLPVISIPHISRPFYRLPLHTRSFCYTLIPGRRPLYESEVLVFKGMEPAALDFEQRIVWLKTAASSGDLAEDFSLLEGKIPGAVSVSEALSEARIAAQVQQRHLRYYNTLARIPLPLLVGKHEDSVVENADRILRRRLSGTAYKKVQKLLDGGLGYFVYFYPQAPIRAEFISPAKNRRFVKSRFGSVPSSQATIQRWITLFARLIRLGFLPASPRSLKTGCCVSSQNANLDGGVCDVDSIFPLTARTSASFIRKSLLLSARELEQSARCIRARGSGMSPEILERIRESLLSADHPCDLRIDRRVLTMMDSLLQDGPQR